MSSGMPPDPAPAEPPSRFAGLGTLLFSFHGRMSRRDLWMRFLPAYLIVGLAALILAEVFDEVESDVGSVIMLAFFVFTLWSGSAALVKRCHDRGRSLWFLGLALAPSLLIALGGAALLAGYVAEADFATRFFDDMARLSSDPALAASYSTYFAIIGLLGFLANIFQLWIMIELYFLRGTIGDNRYGPDPAARA